VTGAKLLRCAIYTRKSSEEGLEQEFNSLHAQRESCEAYVRSQQHEGWRLQKTAYDDGGFSGGSTDRPALQNLLTDIRAGRLDVVVVYKVDRLTRSLTDFSRIVETFEAHKVSFVSVTQSFNSTSSMGRLTLNVLLSFAQFEREVTGERIRDKIAASRKKGMWMGGHPPLGYDVRDRKLVVNAVETVTVRNIYEQYLKLGSVRDLAKHLATHGIRSKRWTTQKGVTQGGSPFSRGALYAILQNRLYLGEAVHKDKVYPGEHLPTVPRDLWGRVQKHLAAQRRKNGANGKEIRSPLTGLLFDDQGHPMIPSSTSRGKGKRYRYYVSRALIAGKRIEAGSLPRVSAPAIESAVESELKNRLPNCERADFERAAHAGIRRHTRRVILARDQVTIELAPEALVGAKRPRGRARGPKVIEIPIRLRARGGETLIVVPRDCGQSKQSAFNRPLVKALGQAWRWRQSLERRKFKSVTELASSSHCTEPYVCQILRLAYLAPDIMEAILNGYQPIELTLARIHKIDIPLDWPGQRSALGFESRA